MPWSSNPVDAVRSRRGWWVTPPDTPPAARPWRATQITVPVTVTISADVSRTSVQPDPFVFHTSPVLARGISATASRPITMVSSVWAPTWFATASRQIGVPVSVTAQLGKILGATRPITATIAAASAAHYTDDFNRDNSTTTPGPNWTAQTANKIGVSSNKAYCVTSGDYPFASYTSTMSSDNHKVSAKIYGSYDLIHANHYLVMGAGSDIMCVLLIWGDSWYISTMTSWAMDDYTPRSDYAEARPYDGDTVSLERSGSVFTARLNGTSVVTWDDSGAIVTKNSSHRTVGIGLTYSGTGVPRWDDFAADDI